MTRSSHANKAAGESAERARGCPPPCPSEFPISLVAHDFDLIQCGVVVGANRATAEFTFSGTDEAVANARCGILRMCLTPFCFEPIEPRQGWESGQPQQDCLNYSVDRQMRRIVKYLKRGFTWGVGREHA